jgi:uncharacterized damage-inducible protein DinB
MNANAFRHLFDYHFAENRQLWAHASTLTDEQLGAPVAYSHGSIRGQLLHMVWADDVWFSQLRRDPPPAPPDPGAPAERAAIRAHWDAVEERMRGYLGGLRDEMLFEKPFPDHPEDRELVLWQVLVHVVNHGTDHRAQVLRLLHDLGIDTRSQDYIFYTYDHPLP